MNTGWIGVDLDGTLAEYIGWVDPEHIGKPIPLMMERVVRWLTEGHDVRIFTARVSHDNTSDRIISAAKAHAAIRAWCQTHIGQELPVTCIKDYGMIELWDDRAVQVRANTGERIGNSTRGLD